MIPGLASAMAVGMAVALLGLAFSARGRERMLGGALLPTSRVGPSDTGRPGSGRALGGRRRPGLLRLGLGGTEVRTAGRGAVRIIVAGVSLLGGWLVAGPPGALAGLLAGTILPAAVDRRRRERHAELLDEQLGEAVTTIAAGLRSGLSLPQAIRFAADEGHAPLAGSLRAIGERSALGLPLEDSLDVWAKSHGGPDSRLVTSVFQLHHRTGGDLPRVLDQVARTLTDRRATVREVRSLTAQARLSGAILGLLPIGFFLFLSATSPDEMAAAYRSPAGLLAIGAGLLLQGVAFVWIRKLLRVDG